MEPVHNMQDLEQTLIDAGDDVVAVRCGAEWCIPCHRTMGEYKTTLERFHSVKAMSADYDKSQELFEHYEATTLPTILLFRNCELVDILQRPNASTVEGALLSASPLQHYRNPPPLVLDAEF